MHNTAIWQNMFKTGGKEEIAHQSEGKVATEALGKII